ncbi:MAG: hypothetical protein ACRDVP_04585 [Acidimicrobiales bacterium]
MTYQDPEGIFWRRVDDRWECFNGSEWAPSDDAPPGHPSYAAAKPARGGHRHPKRWVVAGTVVVLGAVIAAGALGNESHPKARTAAATTLPMSPPQYEAMCTASPNYGTLSSPNTLPGACVTYQAQVFQYDANTGANSMLVYVTNDGDGFWSNLVQLLLPPSAAAQNFVENDIIQFWGPTGTPDTYDTSIGGSNTVPSVNVQFANLVSPAP